MRIATARLIVLVSAAAALAACKPAGVRTLGDYFEAKEAYATVLDNWLSQNNPNWRVIAVYGPVYEPGTPMFPGSTEPLTDACLVPADQVNTDEMSNLPRVTESSTFDLSATVPAAVAKAREMAVTGGAQFNRSSSAVLEYKDLSQRAVRTDVFDENLMRPDCLAVIAGREVTIVRGQIVGKETISSTKTLSAGATASVLEDEALSVSYDRTGGFSLEDTEVKAKYFYVVNRTISIDGLPPNATDTMRRAAVRDFFRSESTGDLEFSDRRPTGGEVEVFRRQARAHTN